jgi:3-isopropylmalate dehydrogenase
MRIALLPGDGIGPEIVAATEAVLAAADGRFGLRLAMERVEVGFAALARAGTTFPREALERCRAADGIVLGPVSHAQYPPRAQGGLNPSAELHIGLDLYANVRPSRTRPGLAHWGRTPMDLVIVRENTEGFYADRNMHAGSGEFMPAPGVALAVRKVTARASRRIARVAFELARRRRRKVTVVHKRNVMRVSDALFVGEVQEVAREFPDVTLDDQLVDSMAALLVRDAQRFDVVVTTNMFGDILSDEAAELCGSLGLGASLNAGDDRAMAQAQHGSAPDIAGRDLANPASLILSAAMLLDRLASRHGRQACGEAARAIEAAVESLLADPRTRTRDLGGALGTLEFAAAACAAVSSRSSPSA